MEVGEKVSCECSADSGIGKIVRRSVEVIDVRGLLERIDVGAGGRLRLILLRRDVVLVFMIGSDAVLSFVVRSARVSVLLRMILLVRLCEAGSDIVSRRERTALERRETDLLEEFGKGWN